MPVIEHATHESTIQRKDARYGCYNRTHKDSYTVENKAFVVSESGTTIITHQMKVPSVMSKECRFDMSLTDSLCQGCKHQGSGEQYANKVRMAA